MRAPDVTLVRARDLRKTMTLPEVLLWRALRGRRVSPSFRRQHPLGPYILDFFCPAAALAVEVDGDSHSHPEAAAKDARRDRWLASRGIETLRIPAPNVLKEPDEVAFGVIRLAETRATERLRARL